MRLLAPTGKARVRLGKDTGYPGHAQTVAQLLLGDRFDPDTGRYFTNPRAPKIEATTCIVDESSMLTEDMLAAVVDAIPENCRLILVGDPNQLPPIGAGCPRHHRILEARARRSRGRRTEHPSPAERRHRSPALAPPTSSLPRCSPGAHCRQERTRSSSPRSRGFCKRSALSSVNI